MQAAKLEHYRQRLIEERDQLIRELNRIGESIPEEVRPPGEHEIAPSEGIDVDITLGKGEGNWIDEIDAALNRIRDGSFGKCCRCGRKISERRLEALPFARYCVRCEEAHRPEGRRVKEKG